MKSRMRYALEKLREALEEYRDLAQGGAVMRRDEANIRTASPCERLLDYVYGELDEARKRDVRGAPGGLRALPGGGGVVRARAQRRSSG